MTDFKLTTDNVFKIVIVTLLTSIFYLLITKKRGEPFVSMGEHDKGTCIDTCAQDGKCMVSLYNTKLNRCYVAQDFAVPEDVLDEDGDKYSKKYRKFKTKREQEEYESDASDIIAFRKMDLKRNPHTFIRSDTEERVNVDEMGVAGQGLPIDWTQDENVEHALSRDEIIDLARERANQYKLDDVKSGFPDVGYISYYREQMKNVKKKYIPNAFNQNIYDLASTTEYVSSGKKPNPSPKCTTGLTLPDCMVKCKKNNKCKSLTWDPENGDCCFKKSR